MGGLGLLLYIIVTTSDLSQSGFRVDIVSSLACLTTLHCINVAFFVVIVGLISLRLITLHRSFKSTISRIIAHAKNSMFRYIAIYLPLWLTRGIYRFQKAIKKVRAVQRLRRTRGFAFSQTETAGQQDQARLIRAYDTSKSHHRPSGL